MIIWKTAENLKKLKLEVYKLDCYKELSRLSESNYHIMSTVRSLCRNLSYRPQALLRKFSDTAPIVYTIENVAYPRRHKNVASLNCKTVSTLEVAGNPGVYAVSLNRPSRGNAFNMQMWHELQETFQAANTDHSVRAIILTGNSVSFSTGMDLSVFAEMQKLVAAEPCEGRKREALSNFIQFLQDAISAPEVCAVPVIAAISGHCIGGAVDLITACDLRYCTDNSTFCVKETDLAMVADIGTLQRLPKLIGDQQTRELAYTGRTINGIEAQSLGLVLKSFATEELMRQHVDEVASAIAKKSPLTVR